jgi:hypothetical protein
LTGKVDVLPPYTPRLQHLQRLGGAVEPQRHDILQCRRRLAASGGSSSAPSSSNSIGISSNSAALPSLSAVSPCGASPSFP